MSKPSQSSIKLSFDDLQKKVKASFVDNEVQLQKTTEMYQYISSFSEKLKGVSLQETKNNPEEKLDMYLLIAFNQGMFQNADVIPIRHRFMKHIIPKLTNNVYPMLIFVKLPENYSKSYYDTDGDPYLIRSMPFYIQQEYINEKVELSQKFLPLYQAIANTPTYLNELMTQNNHSFDNMPMLKLFCEKNQYYGVDARDDLNTAISLEIIPLIILNTIA